MKNRTYARQRAPGTRRELLFRDWNAFRAKAARVSDEWLDLRKDAPIQFYATSARPRYVLCVTKQAMARFWLVSTSLAANATVVVCPGVPFEWHCAMIRREVERHGTSLIFFGDLDPYDLSIYAALALGGNDLRRHGSSAIDVLYGGLDENWIRLATRYFKLPSTDPIKQSMSDFEKEHWNLLRKLVPKLERALSARAIQTLNGGAKIEIDALVNYAFFRAEYRGELDKFLRAIVSQAQEK